MYKLYKKRTKKPTDEEFFEIERVGTVEVIKPKKKVTTEFRVPKKTPKACRLLEGEALDECLLEEAEKEERRRSE